MGLIMNDLKSEGSEITQKIAYNSSETAGADGHSKTEWQGKHFFFFFFQTYVPLYFLTGQALANPFSFLSQHINCGRVLQQLEG